MKEIAIAAKVEKPTEVRPRSDPVALGYQQRDPKKTEKAVERGYLAMLGGWAIYTIGCLASAGGFTGPFYHVENALIETVNPYRNDPVVLKCNSDFKKLELIQTKVDANRGSFEMLGDEGAVYLSPIQGSSEKINKIAKDYNTLQVQLASEGISKQVINYSCWAGNAKNTIDGLANTVTEVSSSFAFFSLTFAGSAAYIWSIRRKEPKE